MERRLIGAVAVLCIDTAIVMPTGFFQVDRSEHSPATDGCRNSISPPAFFAIAMTETDMTEPTLIRQPVNFTRRPLFEKAWVLPAWILLGLSRLVILAIPFRTLARGLGTNAGVTPWIPVLPPGGEARAASISRIVRRAAARTPWQSNCLTQAVAARVLLGVCGIPCSLFFGVARDRGEPDENQSGSKPIGSPPADSSPVRLSAHAWVAAGRVPVTGGVSFRQFTVVGCFVASRTAAAKPAVRLRTP
jgi:hypothetical protein